MPDARMPDTVVRALYKEHAGPVLAYVIRMVGDRQHAEDIVQETLVRAWRHAHRLVPERGSIRSWLLQVAHNIAIDKMRARRSRPTEISAAAGTPPTVNDHADAVLDSVYLAQALATLSQGHRDVLVEVYYRHRTAAEAAKVLGLPVGTVKSRIHNGLRALRRSFEEERGQCTASGSGA